MPGVPDVSRPEAAFPPAPVPRNCRSPHSFMSRSFGLRGTGNPSPRNRQSPHSLISWSFRPPEPFISSPGGRSHAASRRRSRMALFFLPDRAAIPPTRGRLFRLPSKTAHPSPRKRRSPLRSWNFQPSKLPIPALSHLPELPAPGTVHLQPRRPLPCSLPPPIAYGSLLFSRLPAPLSSTARGSAATPISSHTQRDALPHRQSVPFLVVYRRASCPSALCPPGGEAEYPRRTAFIPHLCTAE